MHGFDQNGELTVLIADHDDAARRVVVRMLFRLGYKVLHAGCGEQALTISERYNAPIDLLLTDVVLPPGSGAELVRKLRSSRPGMRVLYMSQHSSDDLERTLALCDAESLIHKPFSAGQLAAHLRDLLRDA
ncbi:MAG TPA: response regulator [Longimicrobiales bacterium]